MLHSLRTLQLMPVACLVIAGTISAQTPTPVEGRVWSLGGGVASGHKGLAGFAAMSSQRRVFSGAFRLGHIEASPPPAATDRGAISAVEVAGLAGVGKRTARTLTAARAGVGFVTRKQCVLNCSYFATGSPRDEKLHTVGLAYDVETGLLVGSRRTFGIAAVVSGNANSAHSFVSAGARLSFGSWR